MERDGMCGNGTGFDISTVKRFLNFRGRILEKGRKERRTEVDAVGNVVVLC